MLKLFSHHNIQKKITKSSPHCFCFFQLLPEQTERKNIKCHFMNLISYSRPNLIFYRRTRALMNCNGSEHIKIDDVQLR